MTENPDSLLFSSDPDPSSSTFSTSFPDLANDGTSLFSLTAENNLDTGSTLFSAALTPQDDSASWSFVGDETPSFIQDDSWGGGGDVQGQAQGDVTLLGQEDGGGELGLILGLDDNGDSSSLFSGQTLAWGDGGEGMFWV